MRNVGGLEIPTTSPVSWLFPGNILGKKKARLQSGGGPMERGLGAFNYSQDG